MSFFKQVFKGNRDRNTVVSHGIIPPIRARYLRLHPKSWRSHISMRVEFYGCAVGELRKQSQLCLKNEFFILNV